MRFAATETVTRIWIVIGSMMKGTLSDWKSDMIGITTSAERVPVDAYAMHVETVAMIGEARPICTTMFMITRYLRRWRSSTLRLPQICERYASSHPISLTTLGVGEQGESIRSG